MSERQEFKVLKLDRNNYVIWKWQFQNVARAGGLGELFGEGEITQEKDGKGLALLGSALSDDNILKIVNCTSFRQAWQTIEQCYENKTSYEPQFLYRKLNSFKIKTAADVSSGLSEMRGIAAQLENLNEKVSENCLIGAILSALPESFNIFVTVWKNSQDKSVDSLVSKLMAEANEQVQRSTNEANALVVRARHASRKNSRPKDQNRPQTSKDQCRYCKETGHWIKDCPNLKTPYVPRRKSQSKSSDDRSKSPGDRKNSNKDLAFMALSDDSELDKETWIVDSGCSHHMSPFRSLFETLESCAYPKTISLASKEGMMRVEGIGQVKTETLKLRQVLYVPELRTNLFSMSVGDNNGLSHTGSNGHITFFYDGSEVFRAKLEGNIYVTRFKPVGSQLAIAGAATLREWHARFGHVSTDIIQKMKKDHVVDGLDFQIKPLSGCVDCSLNKCTKASHPLRTTPKATKAGNVLHIDTAGPSNIVSKGNSKYLILCKDEASGYRQVAFAHAKSEIPNKVKLFVSRASLETNNCVLKIVTDNGTEYVNKDLEQFLNNRGIIHDRSAPSVPNQNGFIERDIRTIKESAKTMLNRSKISKDLWPEAICCAVYSLNRVINSRANKTPYEQWFNRKPDVSNLRIFGEEAILKKQADKLEHSWDEKGVTARFVNYTDRFNTYRFLLGNKIVVSCDWVFINQEHQGDHDNAVTDPDCGEYWISMNERGTEEDSTGGDNVDPTLEEDGSGSDAVLQPPEVDHQGIEDHLERPERNPTASNSPATINNTQQSEQGGPSRSSNRTREEIQNFIEANREVPIQLRVGNITTSMRIGDIYFHPQTGRWKTHASGHFVSGETINRLMDSTTRASSRLATATANINSLMIPRNYKEAVDGRQRDSWIEAMDDEMKSLVENEVFVEVPEEMCSRPVTTKWVFTVKYARNGTVEKFKARVVARGFSQIYGIDYFETYCSVVQVMTTRLLLSHATQVGLFMRQFDIKTAFLHGHLEEEIYVRPPEGYAAPGKIWRLKRALYGLKQSPRVWNNRFSQFMMDAGFTISHYDGSVYYQHDPFVAVIVYVDDGIIFAAVYDDITSLLSKMDKQFRLRDMELSVYRGLEISKEANGILVNQRNYACSVIESLNMTGAAIASNPITSFGGKDSPLDPIVPYRSAVGSLSYLADFTRPDISYAVNCLARKTAAPTNNDWKAVKQFARYLKGTPDIGILFRKDAQREPTLVGYSDSDFAGDSSSSKSTTGYIILFNDAPIHWKAQLQKHVTLSSTEAEVIAMCAVSKELAWIRRMILELKLMEEKPAQLLCDNKSALAIVKSERATLRTRHLRAQDAYIREQIELNELELFHVPSNEQLADFLTKTVATGKFKSNVDQILTGSP